MTDENKALAIVPRSLPEVMSLAEVLAKSTLLPAALRGKVPDVAMQIMTGRELGLDPMASIRGIHITDGKPTLSADTMVGLVLSSGLAEYFTCTESSATSCTWITKRKNSPHEQKCTWTTEDVKKAGLATKDNHRLFPRQMLSARCKAELARSAYPDVLAGVYDPDEVSVPLAPRAQPVDAVDAEVVTEDETAIFAAIDDAPTQADLDAMVPQLKLLKNGVKAEAQRRWAARRDFLKTPPATPTAEPEVA